ncbi:MAG TPA: DUF2917 domain-containing protein [Chthoniobacterales bacterium]
MNTPSRPSLGKRSAGSANQTSSPFQAHRAKPRPKITLSSGALLAHRVNDHETLTLTVSAGHAWITNEGDPEDYILAAGEIFEIAGPARLLVEGIHDGAEFDMEFRHTGGMILAS